MKMIDNWTWPDDEWIKPVDDLNIKIEWLIHLEKLWCCWRVKSLYNF